MHDGVSPQPENRNTTRRGLCLRKPCASHPPSKYCTASGIVNLSTFFPSLSLSPFLCSFQFINLFYGAKVFVENWSFFNWTMVTVLASLSLPEKLPIFFPAHQTWSLSLSLSQKHSKETKGLFIDGSINQFS